MHKRIYLLSLFFFLLFQQIANANDTGNIVRNQVQQDIVAPFKSSENRPCVDGTNANGRNIIDYWVDLECQYCRIDDILIAQKSIQSICIVIRHSPAQGGDSVKKALAYEALRTQSVNAANMFWSNVLPGGAVSVPYNHELAKSMESIMLPADKFNTLIDKVTPIVSADTLLRDKILYTPTFVIEGFRFPACDFSADQLKRVIPIAQSARKGDKKAVEQVITIITNGINGEPML